MPASTRYRSQRRGNATDDTQRAGSAVVHLDLDFNDLDDLDGVHDDFHDFHDKLLYYITIYLISLILHTTLTLNVFFYCR